MKKILLAFLLLSNLRAYCFKTEFRDNITIRDTVYGDLYVAGGRIDVNAPILGDLVIAGGTVYINDSVSGDILLAGGEAFFNGRVGDDIRCAGGRLTIRKNVYGHLLAAGGEITIAEGVTIGGIMVSGGNILINGQIIGPLRCYGGQVQLNGNVDGDADIRGGKIGINGAVRGKSTLSAGDLDIGERAAFYQRVNYWTEQGEINFGNSLKNTRAVFDPSLEMKTGRWEYMGFVSFLGVLWYLAMAFLMIMLLQYLFSSAMKKAGENTGTQTWKSFGFGFLFLAGVPVAAVIAMVTLIGLPVGLLLVFLYIILLLLLSVITSTVLSNWFSNRKNAGWGYWHIVLVSLGIFILLKITGLIPVIGWLLVFIISCIALGAVITGSIERIRKKNLQEVNSNR